MPDSVWQLLDWTARGDIVIIEWQSTRMAGGKRFDWRGVDKFHLYNGKIREERVYMDTVPLRAAAKSETLEAVIPLEGARRAHDHAGRRRWIAAANAR